MLESKKMKYFAILCTLIIIAAVPAVASVTDKEYTDTVDLYRIRDNFQYTDSPMTTYWEHKVVYTEGDGKIPLTIYAGNGNPKRSHLTATPFCIEPRYIAGGLCVSTKLNSMKQEGEVRVEIERSILGVHLVPEPASLILGTLGISLVGYLRRRKTL